MVFTKNGLSRLSPDYSLGQAWPDLWPEMANVCYCHEFNDMNELNDRKDVVHAYVMY